MPSRVTPAGLDPTSGWDARPMLAVAGELPNGAQWAYEFKWDGVRALVSVLSPAAGGIKICSRSGGDVTVAYPDVVSAARDLLDASQVPLRLDGEIVAFDGQGRPSFGALQSRMAVNAGPKAARLAARTPAVFLPFDILARGDESTMTMPYDERRGLLEELPLQTPPSLRGAEVTSADVLDIAKAQGLEGAVAKRRSSTYEPGRRSANWVKQALKRRQDVVIGGWEPGQSGRAGRLGALLVGVHDASGNLVYAGQVGAGFTDKTLADLQARLQSIAIETPPFADAEDVPPRERQLVRWVRPELVAAVEFRQWTADGRLRAPSFKGLRSDVSAEEVVREP